MSNRPGRAGAETAPRYLAAIGGALQIEDAGGAFEIGQRFGIGSHQPLELGARGDLEPHHFDERHIVALQDAVECDDLAVDIVDHLDRCGLIAAQEHAAHADERLGIGVVRDRRDAPGQALCQAALATDIGGDGLRRRTDGTRLDGTRLHESSPHRITPPVHGCGATSCCGRLWSVRFGVCYHPDPRLMRGIAAAPFRACRPCRRVSDRSCRASGRSCRSWP